MQELPTQDPKTATDDPYSRLTPELKQFLAEEIESYGKAMTAFKAVVDETAAGKPLTKATLDELDTRYKKEKPDIGKFIDITMAIEKTELENALAAQKRKGPSPHESVINYAAGKLRALLPEEIADRIDIDGIGKNLSSHITKEKHQALEMEISDKLSKDYYDARDAKRKEWDDAHPEITSGLKPERLNRAFARDHLSPPAHQKNVTLNPDTRDVKTLLADMLSKNRGVAVGEVHTMDDSCNLLSENMGTLKAAGVDTIYLETDSESFKELYDQLSTQELKELAERGRYKDRHLLKPEEIAEVFGVKYADDKNRAHVTMLIAARENGIRLVPMDTHYSLPAAHGDLRAATSNVVWMENIEADRKKLAEQGKGDGKFVVLGGMGHFQNSHDGIRGLTDESLGIPALVLAKGDPATAPGFKKGTSPNGGDFYVSGGLDYYDSAKTVKATDMAQTADALSPLATMPLIGSGIGMASATLKRLAEKYHKEAEDEVNLPVEDSKELPGTSPPLPAKPASPEKTR